MKRISDQALALVTELRLWRGSVMGVNAASILRKFSALGEPAVIPYLTPILFYGLPSDRAEVTPVIYDLLTQIRADDYADLDEKVRGSWRLEEDFRKINAKELAKLVGPGLSGTLLIQMSTMHPNGYVREEAVKRIGLIKDGSELPYLLVRLNDWVPAVRRITLDAIIARLVPAYASHFLDNLVLVIRLESAHRNDHKNCLEKIYGLLQAPSVSDQLIAALNDADKRVRRKCLDLLLAGTGNDLDKALESAWSSTDTVLRTRALNHIASLPPSPRVRLQLLSAFRDPFFTIRREALRYLLKLFPEESRDRLAQALFDPSASVRASARFHLRELGVRNIADIYRRALGGASEPKLYTVLSGLAEIGNGEDFKLIQPFLTHARASVRKAAVRGVARLAGDQGAALLFPLIWDASPGVSRQARQGLIPNATELGGERLLELALGTDHVHVWTNALALMAALSKWDAVLYLARVINRDDARKTALAWLLIVRINPQFLRPSARQIQLIQAELAMFNLKSKSERNWASRVKFALDLHSR
jgi:HEAT repeat protein